MAREGGVIVCEVSRESCRDEKVWWGKRVLSPPAPKSPAEIIGRRRAVPTDEVWWGRTVLSPPALKSPAED
jgi:hypothetical protein